MDVICMLSIWRLGPVGVECMGVGCMGGYMYGNSETTSHFL